MTPDTPPGKTAWDVIAAILKSPWLFVSIALVLAGLFLATHLVAKPGTEVVLLWGAAKYQKGDPPTEVKTTPPPEDINMYLLPKNKETHQLNNIGETTEATYPILDGGINFVAHGHEVEIGGVNIEQIYVAARSGAGEPLSVIRKSSGKVGIKQADITYIELAYKGNIFSIVVDDNGENIATFKVEPIRISTLKQSSYLALSHSDVH